MKRVRFPRIVITCLLAAAGCCLGADEKKPAQPDYVRFVEDEKGARLQTAVARFQDAAGTKVDLIGAVHIADKAYYDALNARFKTYESVLYELVGGEFKERATRTKPEGASRLQWVSWLHETMRTTLALTSQMEGINYSAGNFVHADMGTGEFFGTQKTKGESFLGLFFKAWAAQMSLAAEGDLPEQPGLAKVLEILCRKDSPTELKRLVGREFDQIEKLMAGIEAEGGTVIIGERNRVALEVLDRIIAQGRMRIAVFYGAAHLADMEQRLATRGFKKMYTEWMTAWDMPPPPQKSETQRSEPQGNDKADLPPTSDF